MGGSVSFSAGGARTPAIVEVYPEGDDDPWAADTEDDDYFLELGEPAPLVREPPLPPPLQNHRMTVEVARLSLEDIGRMWPTCAGPGASVIFAVLATCHLARRRQRLGVPAPVGGFCVWALRELRDAEQADDIHYLSIRSAARLIDDYGASTLYSDRSGAARATLAHLADADEYPGVKIGAVNPRSFVDVHAALSSGSALAVTWHHGGTRRAELHDGTETRQVLVVKPQGLVPPYDLVSGCIVGFDSSTRLFYGYSPAVTTNLGLAPTVLISMSPEALDTTVFVEAIRCVLEEKSDNGTISDIETDGSQAVDDNVDDDVD